MLGQEFGEHVFLLGRADDEDGAGVADGLGDILEERLVLLNPVARPLLSGVNVANNMVPDHRSVRLLDVEVKYARPFVIDPDHSVIMMGHCALLKRIHLDQTPKAALKPPDSIAPGEAAL